MKHINASASKLVLFSEESDALQTTSLNIEEDEETEKVEGTKGSSSKGLKASIDDDSFLSEDIILNNKDSFPKEAILKGGHYLYKDKLSF